MTSGAIFPRQLEGRACFNAAMGFVACVNIALASGEDRVPLPPVDIVGMNATGREWIASTPIYEEGAGGFCMEAELASSFLRSGETAEAVRDRAAKGGAYLSDPKPLAFEVHVGNGNRYSLYLLIRKNPTTWRGPGMRLNKDLGEKRSPEIPGVTLDGKPVSCEPFKTVGDKWRWHGVASFTLAPGVHLIQLNDLPGYFLDRMVVARKAKADAAEGDKAADMLANPKEEGSADGMLEALENEVGGAALDQIAPSTRRVVAEAAVTTASIQPLAVGAWRKITVAADSAGCTPQISVSTNEGTTWQALAADGDLAGILAQGNGQDSLCARVVWRPQKPQQVPRLSGVEVSYSPGDAAPVTVEGGGLSIGLDPKNGSLRELRRAGNGERLALPQRRDLFELAWRPSGEDKDRVLAAGQFVFEGIQKESGSDGPSWSLAYSNAEASLRAVCRIAPPAEAEGQWRWTIQVANGGGGMVRSVSFPRLYGLVVGDKAVMPEALWGVPYGTNLFPGSMSMGFVFLHDEHDGLYLASHDKSLVGVGLGVDPRGTVKYLSAISFGVTPPKTDRSYEYALALGRADWHWAADRYREWACSWMRRPIWPEWARREDGWWSLEADSEGGLLDRRSTTIFEDARWFGLRHLQLWVGNGDGEFCGRLPYLSPRLGTPEMSRKDCERIRRLGGHVGHYIQSREWVAGFATNALIGSIPRVCFPSGFSVENDEWSDRYVLDGPKGYHGPDVRIMCPASSGWQEHIARHAGERVSLFGNDAAYFDQMGCTAMACSDPGHGHGPEYEISGAGYAQMAEKAVDAMRRQNPNVAISEEGMNAATGQYVHFHLISSRPDAEHGKYFLYTFPDAALFRGAGNGVFKWQGWPPRRFFRSLSLFDRFEVPLYDLYFRDVVLLRQRVNDWQYGGRFMDDAGLRTTAQEAPARLENDKLVPAKLGVSAKWFLYAKGGTSGVLINYCNEDRLGGVRLTLDRSRVPFEPSGHAFAYFDDGSVEPMRYDMAESALSFTVPVREVGSILIPGPVVAPSEALRVFAWQTTTAGPDRLALTAVNITGRSIKAAWSVRVPPGFKLETSSGAIDVDAFGVGRVDVPIRDLCAAQAMADAVVDWSYAGQTTACTAVLSPPLRNGSMDLDENGDGSPDSWWSFNNSFVHIIHRYVYDVDMRSLPAVCDTEVKHSGRASARLRGSIPFVHSVNNPFGYKGDMNIWTSSISQHLYVKPQTAYRVTAYAYCKDPRVECEMSAGGEKIVEPLTPGEWKLLKIEFRTTETVVDPSFTLANRAKTDLPVWFDDVRLEETGPAK